MLRKPEDRPSAQRGPRCRRQQRSGSIMGLFAFMLPVILIICLMAINVAYMQLTRTEMKVATDASARAAGRALSINQSTNSAMDYAQSTAALNMVAGKPLSVPRTEEYITFGKSSRTNNGYGRYQFTAVPKAKVDSGQEQVSSVRVLGKVTAPLLIRYPQTFNQFTPTATAISTQVDRDIALILDRSGSMGDYKDYDALEAALNTLYKAKKISKTEYNNGVASDVYGRSYSSNVIKQLSGDPKLYAQTYQTWLNGGVAPEASRWALLRNAVNAFLDVLEKTDQKELVSVASFSSTATLDLKLESNYSLVRNLVAKTRPYNATAIGKGMETGMPSLLDAARARPFAAKTIVVMTDGINNTNPDPVTVAKDIVKKYNVTIHTVTVSPDADQSAMKTVASIGHGKHYHANTGDELVAIFEEIANNLPTILTE